MAINTVCTGCGMTLSVQDEHAGKRARCPSCGQIYTVPLQSTTSTQGEMISPTAEVSSPSQLGSSVEQTSQFAPAAAGVDQFWMRTADGAIYGPVDRMNLDRWFSEGRVGLDYQIRQGETGGWRSASEFRPGPAVNPYAPATFNPAIGGPAVHATGALHRYPKPDRGALVLIMGILSFVICFFFGIVAVVMGRSALNDIQAGQANPNDKTMVQIGFWLGVASLILNLAAIGLFFLVFALGAIQGR